MYRWRDKDFTVVKPLSSPLLSSPLLSSAPEWL
jgi:hypothetical protein